MSRKILHYDKLYSLHIHVYMDGSIYKGSCFERRNNAVFGKMLLIDPEEDDSTCDSAKWDIAGVCKRHINVDRFPTVFVSKKSKIPRDTLRNSGYTITLDPNKANATIIPKMRKDEPFATEKYDIVIHKPDTNSVYLVILEKRGWVDDIDFLDKHVENVKKFIKEEFFSEDDVYIMYHARYFERNACTYIPNCEEYKDILLGNHPANRNYVMDNNVDLLPSVNISIDTLMTWQMCRDKQILEKAIVNSDYQKYPFTTAVFIAAEKDQMLCYSTNAQFKRVLEIIEYYNLCNSNRTPTYTVTPEDFNMLQSWIMYKLGLPETGGWVDTNLLHRLSSLYTQFLKTRLACAPMKMNECVDVDIIKDQIRNFNNSL